MTTRYTNSLSLSYHYHYLCLTVKNRRNVTINLISASNSHTKCENRKATKINSTTTNNYIQKHHVNNNNNNNNHHHHHHHHDDIYIAVCHLRRQPYARVHCGFSGPKSVSARWPPTRIGEAANLTFESACRLL